MVKRTAIMHDDMGVITGPDGSGQRFSTVTELKAAIDAYGGDPVMVVINSLLTHTGGNITLPENCWLVFTGAGRFQVEATYAVTITGCILAPGHLRIFSGAGDVLLANDKCFRSGKWWGGASGWTIPTMWGPIDIEGDLSADTLIAQAGYFDGGQFGCLQATGGTGASGTLRAGCPLILSRDPVLANEAATREWVIDLISGTAEGLEVDNFRKITFHNACVGAGVPTIEYEADGPIDELHITLGADSGLQAVYTDLEFLYPTDDVGPPQTPADVDTWFTSVGVDNTVTNPALITLGVPGVSFVACP